MAEASGLVMVEPRTERAAPNDNDGRLDGGNHFNVVGIQRFPAGQQIPAFVGRVSELVSDKRLAKRCSTLLDITSTGAAPMRVMAERGMNTADKRLVKTVTKRVGSCLRHHRNKGLLRSSEGLGQHLVWEIAR